MEPIEPKTASRRLYSSLDIYKAVFDGPPARRSIEELDAGILSHMRRTSCAPSAASRPPAPAET